jgi:uncharacterized protein YqeY
MALKQRIDADLKVAMLSGERLKVETLRGLKSAILNEEVSRKVRDTGLDDDSILQLFAKESKKRTESAGFFDQGGNQEAAEKERAEKEIIDSYLPAQLNEAELKTIVSRVILDMNADGSQMMGQVIGKVRAEAGPSADGGMIARLVKESLNK